MKESPATAAVTKEFFEIIAHVKAFDLAEKKKGDEALAAAAAAEA